MANHKVLLIDYEPKSIERIVRPLEEAGFAVETATDGLAGLEAFERIQPSLVIIEAMIPKKHGFEVCQEIKKSPRGKRTPVVITTAVYKGRKYRTQALHIYGCDEYVEKPIAENALVALVRRLVGAESEPVAVASAPSASAAVATESAPVSRPAAVTPPPAPPKKTGSVSSIVGDLTEQEIMDRLDALLPSDPFEGDDESLGSVISSLSQSAAAEPAADAEEDSADLSDDGVFHLPDDLADIQLPEAEPLKAAAPDSAQVVSFEDGRSRRNRKAPAPEPIAPVAPVAAQPAAMPAPKPAPRVETREPIAPRPAPVAEAPAPVQRKKSSGGAVWIGGAVACVVLLAGAYLMFFRKSEPTANDLPSPVPVQQAPVETPARQEPVPVEPVAAEAPATTPPVETPTPAAPTAPTGATASPRSHPNSTAAQPAATPRRESAAAPKPAPAAPVAATQAPVTKTASDPAGAVPAAAAAPPPVEKKDGESGDRASPIPTDSDPGPPSAKTTPNAQIDSLDPPPPPSLATGTLPLSKAAPTGTMIAEDADIAPVAVSRPLPSYTAKARTLRQEGTVVFRVLIDETGHVTDAQLVRGIAGSDLNEATLRSAKQWIYRPARKNGDPVKVWKVEEVTFKR